ncbi:hypothetical protein AB0J83_17620 [Actinoplanes sp. NPDC049596]|uniref:hypothetical protein n=1 Tax=unclassified Actinoplanes TaxID=2626549 RepID=UPI003443FD09
MGATAPDPDPMPQVLAYGDSLVLVRGLAGPSPSIVRRIAREAGRPVVVVAADPPLPVAELASHLAERLPVGTRAIRLVLSHAGRREVAGRLSEWLRVEVVAPTDVVMLLPSGLLFVVGGRWETYRGGAAVGRSGARHPAPSWQEVTGEVLSSGPFTAVPAGFLWHPRGASPAPDVGILALEMDPSRPALILGRGAQADLEAVPRALRRRVALVPYAGGQARAHRLAERLAARYGGDVDVVGGVPGDLAWQPFGQRFAYHAGVAPVLTRWAGQGPPWWRIGSGWAVEVVRCGFWLRNAEDTSAADVARRVPMDDRHPLLFLDPGLPADAGVVASLLSQALAYLPTDLAATLRLVVDRTDADRWAGADAVTARFGPIFTLTPDGSLIAPAEEPATTATAADGSTVTAAEPPPARLPVAEPVPEPSPVAEPVPEPPSTPEAPEVKPPTPAPSVPAPPAALRPPAGEVTGRLRAADESAPAPKAADGGAGWAGPLLAAWEVDDVAPGQTLVAAEALIAGPVPVAGPLTAVWSVTGRRLPGQSDAYVFAAGTRFHLVELDEADPVVPRVALVREVDGSEAGLPDPAVREALRRLVLAYRRAVTSEAPPAGRPAPASR